MVSKNGNGKRAAAAAAGMPIDVDSDFPPHYKWRNVGKNQKILGSEFIKHEPITKIEPQPVQIEFELKDKDEVWSMGPNTYFEIKGQYQVRNPKKGNTEPTPWVATGEADIAEVVVAPNAQEVMIRNIDVFHGNTKINTSDEGRYLAAYLNSYLYANMDEEYKQRLCREPCHPAYGVPIKENSWNQTANSEWKKWAPNIFVDNKTLSWSWNPLHFFPFMQGCNYLQFPQKILPMPLLDKITIRILFHERLDSIFLVKTPADKEYRFAFSEFNLHVEHLRYSPTHMKTILEKRGTWEYSGVTRLMKSETIPAGNTTYKATIQKVPLPEGLFIFAVPKDVLSGLYEYKVNANGNPFQQHNIQSIDFGYGGKNFYLKMPHIGMINDETIEKKLLNDYFDAPPFGMKIDKKKITLASIKDGSTKTPYPHVFMNFCNQGDKTRLIPFLEDSNVLKENLDLDLDITFGTGGATANVTYIIYLYYTDNYITLDLSHKGHAFFTSPYIKMI